MGLYRKKALVNATQYVGPERIGITDPTPESPLLPAGIEWVEALAGPPGLLPSIRTLEGRHFLRNLDWVVTNPGGERYNISDEVFRSTYEEVNARPTGPGTPEAKAEEFDNLRSMYSAAQSREAEREMTGLHTFGWAIKQMQNGAPVQREGWNGKGMYLYLDRGAIRTALTVVGAASAVSYEPCIVMFTAQGKHQPGWLASQADMLAADWRIATPLPATLPTYPSREGAPAGVETHGAGPRGCGMDPGPAGYHYAADGQPRHRLDECRPGVCWTDEPANGAAAGVKS